MTQKFRQRFLGFVLSIISIVSIIPVSTAFAATDYSAGGWNMVNTASTVKDPDGNKVGSVAVGEGVTILYFSGSNAYIEYSASGTAKRGFIPTNNMLYGKSIFPGTCVGKVKTASNTYYAPNTSFSAGNISKGEFVSVLCKKGNWAYIEYNVTSSAKRKRAFVASNSLTYYGSVINDKFYHDSDKKDISGKNRTVYCGPSNKYPTIGEIYSSDTKVYRYGAWLSGDGTTWYYVSYPAGGKTKYGYIKL